MITPPNSNSTRWPRTQSRRLVTKLRNPSSGIPPDLPPGPGRNGWEWVDWKEMTKQQLIEKVAASTELPKAQAEAAVDSVFQTIAQALRSNERVDLRGFGSFTVKDKKERQGRNPRTGEAITIAAKRDASFRAGKELSEELAQTQTAPKTGEAA
jgi:nucleoid DNA-binding protein